MTTQQAILTSYPLLLAKRYEAVLLEDEQRLRVIRLIELYEETLRYLTLIGLAEYNHRGLLSAQVEKDRKYLKRPSLGHWLGLLTSLSAALRGEGYAFQIPPLNQVYSGDGVHDACERLYGLIGIDQPKKVRLSDFLESLVVFRNKKIGHGSLSPWEARQIAGPLEAGLIQWLESLSLIQNRPLLYVDRVEWTGYHFLSTAHKLNSGTSIFPTNLEGDTAIFPKRVYLGESDDNPVDELIPLHPFFAYDKYHALLYIFNELSSSGYFVLRCFYAQSVDYYDHDLEADQELLVGGHSKTEKEKFELEEHK